MVIWRINRVLIRDAMWRANILEVKDWSTEHRGGLLTSGEAEMICMW
jgi:hypothetical protein